jgi:hypothetical protein
MTINDVWQLPKDIAHGERLVLLHLVYLANGKTHVTPDRIALCKACALGERTVYRMVERLKDRDIIAGNWAHGFRILGELSNMYNGL